MFNKIVLASNNKKKMKEMNELLAPLGIQVVSQGSLNISSAEEPFFTFIENSLAKARHASKESGLPAIADDSGICVDALGGAPGVFSARFAGENADDEKNNKKGFYSICAILICRADNQVSDGIGCNHG